MTRQDGKDVVQPFSRQDEIIKHPNVKRLLKEKTYERLKNDTTTELAKIKSDLDSVSGISMKSVWKDGQWRQDKIDKYKNSLESFNRTQREITRLSRGILPDEQLQERLARSQELSQIPLPENPK